MSEQKSQAAVQENKDVVSQALQKAKKPGTLAGLKHTQVQDVISGMKGQIAQALPKHLTADRMIQMASSLISKNPKLAECSASSLVGAVMQASILGFRPVEQLGECYFVPYGGAVQFQIGYKGYIALARRTGELKNIYAEVVHAGDEFRVEYGLEPKLVHVPKMDNENAAITHVYAVARYKDDGYNFIVLSANQIEKLRKRNPMQKGNASGAWATDYEAMAKGKAIKQLAKYMPLSVDFMDATLSDEAVITDKAFTNDQTGLKVEHFTYEPEPVQDAQVMDPTPEPEPTAAEPAQAPIQKEKPVETQIPNPEVFTPVPSLF